MEPSFDIYVNSEGFNNFIAYCPSIIHKDYIDVLILPDIYARYQNIVTPTYITCIELLSKTW